MLELRVGSGETRRSFPEHQVRDSRSGGGTSPAKEWRLRAQLCSLKFLSYAEGVPTATPGPPRRLVSLGTALAPPPGSYWEHPEQASLESLPSSNGEGGGGSERGLRELAPWGGAAEEVQPRPLRSAGPGVAGAWSPGLLSLRGDAEGIRGTHTLSSPSGGSPKMCLGHPRLHPGRTRDPTALGGLSLCSHASNVRSRPAGAAGGPCLKTTVNT